MKHLLSLLSLALLIAGSAGYARADSTVDGAIASHCGATYETRHTALHDAVVSDLRQNDVPKLADDEHALNTLDARCWGALHTCETTGCGSTPEYRIRTRYLDAHLLGLGAPAHRGGEAETIRRLVAEAHFICAEYIVTDDPIDRAQRDVEADASLRRAFDVISTQRWLPAAVDSDDAELFAACSGTVATKS